MSEPFDASAYRFATTLDAHLDSARKLIGEPWTAKNVGPGHVGAEVTMDIEGGITLRGITEKVDGDTMSGTITEVFPTPQPIDWDDEDEDD